MWAALLPEMDSATARFWTQQKKAGVSMGSFIAAHIDILSMFAVERDLKVVAKANGDYASCVDEVRACLKAAEVCKVMFFAAVDIVGYSTFVDSIEEAATLSCLKELPQSRMRTSRTAIHFKSVSVKQSRQESSPRCSSYKQNPRPQFDPAFVPKGVAPTWSNVFGLVS